MGKLITKLSSLDKNLDRFKAQIVCLGGRYDDRIKMVVGEDIPIDNF
jgi:hypothetical protein